MKILIAGSDLNARLLAQYLKLEDNNNDIFLTDEEHSSCEFYTTVKIKENDIASITDFVKYNQIEFTIVTSPIAIINGIADEFKKEGFPVFAPYAEAARITYFNSIAKKIMYKLKINTPKFGIFDREGLAVEYIRKVKFPVTIENDFTLPDRESYTYTTFSKAKTGIQKIFENNNEKIVIESHIEEQPVYIYFITDGYNALPLVTLEKTADDNYIQINAPSQKISEEMIINILQKIIYPLLDDITKYSDMYVGIIGLKVKIHNNSVFVHEFYNSFQNYDFQVFLSLLKDNLLNLLYDTVNGSLADNHNYIKTISDYSYSIILNKEYVNSATYDNIEDDNIISSIDKENYIYTTTAPTVNKAKENLLEYLSTKTDKDIVKQLIKENFEKELKI